MAALEFTTNTDDRVHTVHTADAVEMDGLAEDSDWRDLAACFGRTNLFFPPRAERPQARARRERHARRLCCSCPVRNHCQQYARTHHEYGFWGGESEEDRHLAGYTVSSPIGIRTRATTAD